MHKDHAKYSLINSKQQESLASQRTDYEFLFTEGKHQPSLWLHHTLQCFPKQSEQGKKLKQKNVENNYKKKRRTVKHNNDPTNIIIIIIHCRQKKNN